VRHKPEVCLAFVLVLVLLSGCVGVSDTQNTTDASFQNNNTTNADGNTTQPENRTATKPRYETGFSGFVAEDVPENATVVEYNNSSIEDSEIITRLLKEIHEEGTGRVRTEDRQVGENASELYGNLPIFVPEEGAVRGPDGSPYPPGVYARYRNVTVFFTDGLQTLSTC